MDCEAILSKISLFISGEVEAPEKENIQNHLDSCASCQNDYKFQMAIEKSLKEAARSPMPRAAEFRILARLPLLAGWEPPMYAVVAAGMFFGIIIGAWSYIINSEWFQPVYDGFNLTMASFWAWAGQRIPELLYLLDYIPAFSLVQGLIAAGIAGLLIYKLFDLVISLFWSTAVPVPLKKNSLTPIIR